MKMKKYKLLNHMKVSCILKVSDEGWNKFQTFEWYKSKKTKTKTKKAKKQKKSVGIRMARFQNYIV
jgi:hypothetical protein